MKQKLNIEASLKLIKQYAEGDTDKCPLVIRTDSVVTSDILRDASERLVKGSKKVTIGSNTIINDGLNIVYNYVSSMFDETVELLKGKKYIIIVDWDFTPDEEWLKRMDFIDCFNKVALPVSALYSQLKTFPEDLYIFAREDFHRGLLPIEVNQVTAGTVVYNYLPMELRRVKQMLDELEPIGDSARAAIYPNAFFVGIDDYNPDNDDYVLIEMVTREKYVDKLIDTFI